MTSKFGRVMATCIIDYDIGQTQLKTYTEFGTVCLCYDIG